MDLIVKTIPQTNVKLTGEKIARQTTANEHGWATFRDLKTGVYTIICTVKDGVTAQKEMLVESPSIDFGMAKIRDLKLRSKIKFSDGKEYILMGKAVKGHEANSATLVSEFITESATFNTAYFNSNIHTQIMPRYYNGLNEAEKKTLIKRKFFSISRWPDLQEGESYFWLPMASGYGFSGVFDTDVENKTDYNIGFDSTAKDKIKTTKDGRAGEYLTRTQYNNLLHSVSTNGLLDRHNLGYTAGIVPACDISLDAYVALDKDGYYRILGM